MGKVFIDNWRAVGCCILLAGMLLAGPVVSLATDTVCARVKIEINQELTLERQAFDAHMRIKNGLAGISLENVEVNVSFTDQDGNPVVASSDPANTDALFFIRLDSIDNIDNVGGTGTVNPSTSADIHWLIIPAPGSSNGLESGTLYYVGAKLTYSIGGEEKVTEVTPDYIFVKPMPEITLDYFLPTDVYGDDPLTEDTVEPIVPFSLGVRVKNSGHGAARKLKIESAQPKITENEQGLLIGFSIEGSEVNGEPATDSLLVDFGDIVPNSLGAARWIMTCSLSGKFVSFTAEFSHSDELGGELTSLIAAVNTHFLVRDVWVDLPGRDAVRDFLAKDGGVYRIYESEVIGLAGPDDEGPEVADQSAEAALTGTGNKRTLTTAPAAGFMVVRLTDPFGGQKILKEVIRSDGKILKSDNAWLSHTRVKGGPWQYHFNLFDVNSSGSYTLNFEDASTVPVPPMLQYIQDKTGLEGQPLSFTLLASDPNETTPVLSAAPLPAGAILVDSGDGTGHFDWTPRIGQAGAYEITFKASDGELSDSRRVVIIINSVADRDGDGMLDAWEEQHFGSLERNGSADYDEDGILDLIEFLSGSNPAGEDFAPTTPVILQPADGAEVGGLRPALVIENSTDENADGLSYEFEVFADPELMLFVAGTADVVQTADTTSWTLNHALDDNRRYFWRVRATDGYSFSQWIYGSFFVNTANDPPGPFYLSRPRDDAEVDSLTPILEVTNSPDADEDELSYIFEIFDDSTLANRVTFSPVIDAGASGTTAWQISPALEDNTWYFWRVVAADEDTSVAETAVGSFLINTANAAPNPPQMISPALDREVSVLEPDLVISSNQDGETIGYYFELDVLNTFDSSAKHSSGEIPEGGDITAWQIDGLVDNTRYFWRVKAGDETAESGWTPGQFFTNIANDHPLTPTLRNPGHRAWVTTLTPVLEVSPAVDLDDDSLSYRFEIYDDEDLTGLTVEGLSVSPAWTVTQELTDNTRYYWRVRAEDEHGLTGDWMSPAEFYVKDAGTIEPPAEINVNVATSKDNVLAGLKIYAFIRDGAYTGKLATTDENGTAGFNTADFADGSYVFRVDYLGQQFWSEVLELPGTYQIDVIIDEETVEITVNTNSGPVSGSRIYLYSENGSYLGVYQQSDENGKASFVLPSGISFKFRADIRGGQYWTEATTITSGNTNSIELSAGGGRLQVTVQEEPQSPMAGVRCYLFSPAGSYLGLNQVSDSTGIVIFDVPEEVYRVRCDYLGYQYWSADIEVTVDTNIDMTIVHQDVVAEINGQYQETDTPLSGVRTYLFMPSGSYIGQYRLTDDGGLAVFHLPQQPYRVRADYLGRQYWSDDFSWTDPMVAIPMADARVSVKGSNYPVTNQLVYVYSEADSYLGVSRTTDDAGKVLLRLPEGKYKFRADHQGRQFWSDVVTLTADELNSIDIYTGGGNFELTVLKGESDPLSGVTCHVYSAADAYLGLSGATDPGGRVLFDLADGTCKFRVDYLGHRFWSEMAAVPADMSAEIIIEHETVTVKVTTASGPVEKTRVYLYSASGSYLGRYRETGADGTAAFYLPVSLEFQFRADVLDNQYWSEVMEVADVGVNIVAIDAGGGLLQVTVQGDEKIPTETPMLGQKVYLFGATDAYLGLNAVTDDDGRVDFSVPEGTYKLRVDYLGYRFWSAEIDVIGDTPVAIPVPHMPMEVTVQGVFQGLPAPIEDIKVYLFTPMNSYLDQYQFTDPEGKTSFDLPLKEYRVRADYLGQQYWSEVFGWQDTAVNIPLADVEVAVTGAGFPRPDVNIFVFTAGGTYLGISGTTDSDGKRKWRLPAGDYKFRLDYQGREYWSSPQTLLADQNNPVVVSVGGGSFALTVLKSATTPLEGARCYVFNEHDAYWGQLGATNSEGQVFFNLADGAYKFRVDHLGYRFWSPVYEIPEVLTAILNLGHQDVTVTVEGLYQTAEPLPGLKAYLFTPPNSYLGQNRVTDANGQAAFSLPDVFFQVRVDYLGHEFWSDDFKSENPTVTIVRGLAAVHAHFAGLDAAGVSVCLFGEDGAYLGRKETTDSSGMAEFVLPNRSFKFRVDYGGGQYWSEVVQIRAGEVHALEVDLD